MRSFSLMIAERHFALILEALVIAHERNHRLHKALKQQKKKSQAGQTSKTFFTKPKSLPQISSISWGVLSSELISAGDKT